MAWKVFGKYYADSDTTSTALYQTFSPTNSLILKALRTWVIVIGDPTFTSLSMKVYSNNGGTPGALLYTSSNSITKTTILSDSAGVPTGDGNALKGLYFEFLTSGEGALLKGGDTYHLVLNAVGASGFTALSHFAWLIDAYDPNYHAAPLSLHVIHTMPHALAIIGEEL